MTGAGAGMSRGMRGAVVAAPVILRERNAVMRLVTGALVGAMLMAGAVQAAADAKAPLREVPEIDNNMLWVGIALRISEDCDEIDAQTLKGLSFLWSIKRKANALGYSDDEINAYRKSDAEKARIEARGRAYVKSKGLDPKDADDLCALGHAEIARNSVIGTLLKAK